MAVMGSVFTATLKRRTAYPLGALEAHLNKLKRRRGALNAPNDSPAVEQQGEFQNPLLFARVVDRFEQKKLVRDGEKNDRRQ
jgi:hypothetical protein